MPKVRTVLGDVAPEAIGFTLPHEHMAIALWHVPDRWDYWELTWDPEVIPAEMGRFRELGGTALVDVTPPGVGRDPARLVGLARTTGLHVVMGCGWYRGAYYPAEAGLGRRPVEELADELVHDIEVGVPLPGRGDGSGDGAGAGEAAVRAGINGEIGTDKPWVSALEERVHRAAGQASRRTGAAITTHAVMSPVGLRQLALFEAEGADPGRVVIGHADSYPVLDHYLELIRRGASIEFDFLGMSFTPQERKGEPRLIRLLQELLARGHADRVLLSQDVCHNSQLRHYDGGGYTYLQETFLPRLRAAGVADTEIEQLTVTNPRRLLTLP
jgi:phosphotriesterase-related protein